MKVVRLATLLLVQLPLVFAHVNGEDVYKCAGNQNAVVTVTNATAQLTKGCVQDGGGITFNLKAMHDAAINIPKDSVVIDISEAEFNNSYIKLINAHDIPDNIGNAKPVIFTMSKSKMKGTSKLEFGEKDKKFKLPSHSRLSITHSELTISATENNKHVFTFYALQLVTSSSMEIAHNVITMEYKDKSDTMIIFYIPDEAETIVTKGSSFIILDNKITMIQIGHVDSKSLSQYVWYQNQLSPLTISDTSNYTWEANNINMTAYSPNDSIYQYILFQYGMSD